MERVGLGFLFFLSFCFNVCLNSACVLCLCPWQAPSGSSTFLLWIGKDLSHWNILVDQLGGVVHVCNANTWKVEVERLQIWGHSGLYKYNKTLSQRNNFPVGAEYLPNKPGCGFHLQYYPEKKINKSISNKKYLIPITFFKFCYLTFQDHIAYWPYEYSYITLFMILDTFLHSS